MKQAWESKQCTQLLSNCALNYKTWAKKRAYIFEWSKMKNTIRYDTICFQCTIENVLEQKVRITPDQLYGLLLGSMEYWCGQYMLPSVGRDVWNLVPTINVLSKWFLSISQRILHPEPMTILSTQYILAMRCTNVLITRHILRSRSWTYFHVQYVLSVMLAYWDFDRILLTYCVEYWHAPVVTWSIPCLPQKRPSP